MANRAYGVLKPNADAQMVLFMGGTNDTKVPIPDFIYGANVQSIVPLSHALGLEIAIGLPPPIYGRTALLLPEARKRMSVSVRKCPARYYRTFRPPLLRFSGLSGE
jgi:hypothetical protein